MEVYDKKFYICKGFETEKVNKKLIFYHLPKCAGTTFCNLLKNLFKSSERIFGSPTGERGTKSAYELFLSDKDKYLNPNIDFIFGHFQYQISKYFPNRLSATILRDPVERCISHYNMSIERNFISKNINIEECFKENIIPANVITQIFSCSKSNDINLNNDNFDTALDIILNKINLVYDFNNTANLLNLIISLYDFPNLMFQKLQKTKSDYFERSKKNLEIIKHYNKYDINLYSYLKKNNKFTNINYKNKRKKNSYFLYTIDLKINNANKILVDEKSLNKIKKNLILKNFDIIEI